ncbi:MAG TPA: AmmeMemoRadiSam system protein B [Longimicrobiales bacterium]|nr:AmmeMemoRadiSam system protein B [Longimicrobiales bacterium]
MRRRLSRDRHLLRALLLLLSGPVLPGAAALAQTVGVRPPAVAGYFYPEDPEALKKEVEDLLAAASADGVAPAQPVRAGIVPHAGLDYSGLVAARFYRAVQGREYDAVVLIAVSHQESFAGVSIWPGSRLSTPLGEIPIERALAERLVAADDSIRFATEGYGAEHSLEVQLPFLQTVLPGVPVVPLMVGRQSLDLSYHLARTLATVLAGRNVLLLASSDLSHFHDDSTAARLDGELLDLIRSNDPFLLGYRSFTGELEACGVGGVVAVLEAARRLGAGRTQVLAYDTSGRVTGDMSNVVGYTAVTVSDGPGGSDALTERDKASLVEIARGSVAATVRREVLPPIPELSPALMRKQAAFVTLRSGGELRGCVGAIFATQPVARQVRESAVAASRDTRFARLSADELPRLDYEISLLSPLTPLDDPGSLVIGRDGLMLVQGDRRGVLLPVVAVEQGWDRETFLEQVGVKAGLGRDAWRRPGTLLFSFSTESVR